MYSNSENEPLDKSRPWLKPPEPDFDLKSLPFCAVLSVETTGGTDEIFTVIEKLPKNESFLKTLSKKLMTECRSKGNYRMDRKDGVIEIQGDRRIPIREYFDQQKIKYLG